MTTDQIMGILRVLLQVLGTLATAFGWIAPDKVASLTAQILAVAGPISVLAGTIWSVIANTKSSIIQSASKMPEVTGITTTDATLANAAKTADPQTDVVLK